jgi:hypothetical protein
MRFFCKLEIKLINVLFYQSRIFNDLSEIPIIINILVH